MKNEELIQALSDMGHEEAIVFPDFSEAAVGISQDGRVIYDHERIVEILMADGMEREDAEDYISYNTVRTIDYLGEHAPIIMYQFEV